MKLTQMKNTLTMLGTAALLTLGSNALAQTELNSVISLELTSSQLEQMTAISAEPSSIPCAYCSTPEIMMASEQRIVFSQMRGVRSRFGRNG